MVQVLGETPGTPAPIGSRRMAAVDLARDRSGCRLETGFENHETFTRAFRTRFGITPSAFARIEAIHVALSIAQQTPALQPKAGVYFFRTASSPGFERRK